MLGRKDSNHFRGTTTLIAKGAVITGDLHFSGNLEVEGTISGNVIAVDGAEARVRVLQSGLVEGIIDVPVVIINGRVHGDTHASSQLYLAAHAIVEGNIRYQSLEIEKGAQVNGGFDHIAPVPQEDDKTDRKVAPFKPNTVAEESMVSC